MPPTKVQRWLDLIAFLAGRRFLVTAEEIMAGVPGYLGRSAEADDVARESARRKFERDKDELRDLGVPIERELYRRMSTSEELDGYRLKGSDFYLPYLRLLNESAPAPRKRARRTGTLREVGLDATEVTSAVAGLRRVADLPGFPLAREARSALRKLTFDLDRDALGGPRILYAVPPEEAAVHAVLELLLDALLRRKTVSFTYRGMYRDQVDERTVRPYGLLYQHAHWYLVAHDPSREGERVFRVGRISSPKVNPRRPNTEDFQIPPAFSMTVYADRDPWTLAGDDAPLDAHVRFAFPRSLWAERNHRGEMTQEHADGSVTRAFRVHQAEPFVRWLLSLEGDAAPESPPELCALYDEAVFRLRAIYSEGPGRA